MSTVASKYECLGCGIARRIGGAFCDNPDCDDADPFGPGQSVVDTRTGEATESIEQAPEQHPLRRQFHTPTHLSEEIDALTGYDRAAMFYGYEAASDLRVDAKSRIAKLESKLARLAARFETSGTQPSQADRERDQLLAEIMDDIRTEYNRHPEMVDVPPKRAGEPPTQKKIDLTVAEVEARAKASPRYKRHLEEQGALREEWQKMKAAIAEAWATYEQVKEAGELIRLQLEDRKALIWFASNDPHRRQPHT